MTRRLLSRLRNTDGVAAVELAFVAPLMLLIIGGFLEFGYLSFARSTLESSILEASRASRVTDCPDTNGPLIQASLEETMESVESSDGKPPVLTVKSYGTGFRNVENPEPFSDTNDNGSYDEGEPYTDMNGNASWDDDMGKSGSYGGLGEIVQFSATYNVPSLFPFISEMVNGGQDFYTIAATTVVRNEPTRVVSC